MPENLSRAVVLAAQAGDQESLEEVVKRMEPLLVSRAYRMVAGSHLDMADVIQAGYVAVFEALASYDSSQGSFETWCYTAISREMAADRVRGHAGPSVNERAVYRYWALMERAEGNVQEAHALACRDKDLTMTGETFMSVHNAIANTVSTSSFRYQNQEDSFEIEDTDNMEDGIAIRLLAESFLELLDDPLDVEMIRYSFGLDGGPGLTDQEIADRVGVSRRTVIRRRQAALDTMKAGHSEEEE